MTLPQWISEREGARGKYFAIDPDLAYPLVLDALNVEAPDQYWVEVAYQCTKLAAQELTGFGVEYRIEAHDGRKDRWALANLPEGRGAYAATKGQEARAFFPVVRKALLG